MILGLVRPSDGLLAISLRWDPCKKISWLLFYPMAFLILDDREAKVDWKPGETLADGASEPSKEPPTLFKIVGAVSETKSQNPAECKRLTELPEL